MAEPTCHSALPGAVHSAVQYTARVVAQTRMARDTYCLRLECPPIAEQILPGQFFMVRQPGTNDPLLGRPFALYDVYEEAGRKVGLDFGYLALGKLTSIMSRWAAGQPVELWGPLGNGFPLPDVKHLALVAGGIGQTPFLAVAREALGLRQYGKPPREIPRPVERLTLYYGARSADYLAGLDDFRMPGLDVKLSTDDGTHGHRGFVTEMLATAWEGETRGIRSPGLRNDSSPGHPDVPEAVYCCGPEPMMKAVQQLCGRHGIPCWLSLETPMACGFGICFSCVTRVKLGEGPDDWDYRRTCVEGPVFRGEELVL